MPYTGTVRAKRRNHPRRQQRCGVVQPFKHPCSCPVNVSLVLENHINHGESEGARCSDGTDLRQALQVDRKRVGHLVFHHLRRTAGIIGKNDHLVVGQIRNGIYRCVIDRPSAPGNDKGKKHQHNNPVSGGILYDLFYHFSCDSESMRYPPDTATLSPDWRPDKI